MSRHITFTLDSETAAHASAMRQILMEAVSYGVPVSFDVIGRDSGETTHRSGEVIAFVGERGMSNEAVLVDTDKGTRSFNVWLIRSAQIMGE